MELALVALAQCPRNGSAHATFGLFERTDSRSTKHNDALALVAAYLSSYKPADYGNELQFHSERLRSLHHDTGFLQNSLELSIAS